MTIGPILLDLNPDELARHPGFRPFREGIDMLPLYEETGGAAAAILRYAPGAEAPQHRHEGYEHVYVLSGSQEDEFGSYSAGTLRINAPGSSHHVRSPDGCLILIIWQKPVVFGEPGSARD
jgi:anti-sigma factor ChrR (cupin superfamily)